MILFLNDADFPNPFNFQWQETNFRDRIKKRQSDVDRITSVTSAAVPCLFSARLVFLRGLHGSGIQNIALYPT